VAVEWAHGEYPGEEGERPEHQLQREDPEERARAAGNQQRCQEREQHDSSSRGWRIIHGGAAGYGVGPPSPSRGRLREVSHQVRPDAQAKFHLPLAGALLMHRRAGDAAKEVVPALLALAITIAYLAVAVTG
jgi:hypothetical protein